MSIGIINLNEFELDLNRVFTCNTFMEWVAGEISNAFYLGFFKGEVEEGICTVGDETTLLFLDDIEKMMIHSGSYIKQLSELLEPYIEDTKGFIIQDMVNAVLDKVVLKEEDDIYGVAFLLGIYSDYLYNLGEQ